MKTRNKLKQYRGHLMSMMRIYNIVPSLMAGAVNPSLDLSAAAADAHYNTLYLALVL